MVASSSNTPRRDLIINSDGRGGYDYTLIDYEKRSSEYAGATPSDIVESTHLFLETKYYRTFRRATESTLTNGLYATTLRNLTGLGQHLYQNFVPQELKELVADMKSRDHLHIISDDFSTPWEIIRNGGEFWGKSFIISRAKRRTKIKLDKRNRNVKKIVNVVGAGIRSQVANRARKLFDKYSADHNFQLITINGEESLESTLRVYDEITTADVVHFTCHGQVQNGNIYLQIVQEISDAYNLMVTSIGTMQVKPDCLIFANACISSTTQLLFRQSLGFGSEFCAKGAAAFIGTVDFVPDRPAVLFAENFYDRLFSGENVGEALLESKLADLKINTKRVGLSQLLYSLYGNPYVNLRLR